MAYPDTTPEAWSSPYIDVYSENLGRDIVIAEQMRGEQRSALHIALDSRRTWQRGRVTQSDLPVLKESVATYGQHVETGRVVSGINTMFNVDPDVDLHGFVDDKYQDALHVDIDKMRSILSDFALQQRERLWAYVCLGNPKLFEEQEKKAGGMPSSWFNWLIGSKGVQNPATDTEVMKLLEWNIENMYRVQNDPEVVDRIGTEKESYKGWIGECIDDEVHSTEASNAIGKVDTTQVHIADPFDPVLKAGRVHGYHYPGTGYVVIGLPIGIARPSLADEVSATLPHELNHAVLPPEGRPFVMPRDESMAEHLAAVKQSGRHELISPLVRGEEDPYYPEFRSLTAEMLYGVRGNVDAKIATRAYTGTPKEYDEYAGRVDWAWNTTGLLDTVYGEIEDVSSSMVASIRGKESFEANVEATVLAIEALRHYRNNPSKGFKLKK